MTTAIAIRFPWGQYHATPWGRSVNEAAREWPPSPWRLLRALYATWCYRAPELPATSVHSLLAALAEPPSFLLPPAGEAHTRHYMPDTMSGTDKVFDPFVVTQRQAQAVVRWDTDLEPAQTDVAATLVGLVTYLGRAESVCEISLLDQRAINNLPSSGWVGPANHPADVDASIVRVLGPAHPLHIPDLTVTTTGTRQAGRRIPAGSRWIDYHAPTPASPSSAQPRRPAAARPTVARFAIDAPAPPSLHTAVAVSDLLRRAAMAYYGTPPSTTLSGKDGAGAKLLGHRHAHYLAADLDADRVIDHIAIWAPEGLTSAEVRAVSRLERLSTGQPIDGFRPVRVALEALGEAATALPELVGPSRTWESHTPFAAPRHQKRQQSEESFYATEVNRELHARGLPSCEIETLPRDWLSFRRHRLSEQRDERKRATGLRLHFEQPVNGPLLLGALSHFGLGLFVPARRL